MLQLQVISHLSYIYKASIRRVDHRYSHKNIPYIYRLYNKKYSFAKHVFYMIDFIDPDNIIIAEFAKSELPKPILKIYR